MEQADFISDLLVPAAVRAEDQRLAVAQRQVARPDQAAVKQPVGALLQGRLEIDQDVGAQDQVELVERAICDEVVSGPGDVALEVSAEPCAVAGDSVEIGDLPPAA